MQISIQRHQEHDSKGGERPLKKKKKTGHPDLPETEFVLKK